MSEDAAAPKAPFPVNVEAGTTYLWCACGLSATQPFCDGSHEAVGASPREWTARRTARVWFCGCKQTLNPPLCDGTHGKI